MKKIIIVTGGAGFVGSTYTKALVKKTTNYKIISLDNYSTGKKNHIKNKRIRYLTASTSNIEKVLNKKKMKFTLFHFWGIFENRQSFIKFDECFHANSIGSKAVFKFCLENNIKLIYSATSASLGNNGKDKNLHRMLLQKQKILNY